MIMGSARWAALALAVTFLTVFLVAQRQTSDVTYGDSPGAKAVSAARTGPGDGTVPTTAEMAALVRADPVVRLPGAVAQWDTALVDAALDGSELRIIVAPPGLDDAEGDRVREVEEADIRIIGTQVSASPWQAVADDLIGWRAQFATADVTGPLLLIIAKLRDRPEPADVDTVTWREPTGAELAAATSALRRTRLYQAPGATLSAVPANDGAAFPGGRALYVALPRQPFGVALPRLGPALTSAFPDTPIVVLHGGWAEYHGPGAADFADVAAASFYAQLADRLGRYAYPQENVLAAYLGRVTDVRYAGLYDRPLPYQPLDPLRVALPVLPWLFVACVVLFFALSLRTLLRPPRRLGGGALPTAGTPARLAGLSTLAVELTALDALLTRDARTALTRALGTLAAARAALDDDRPDPHVRRLVLDAEADLDRAARTLPHPGYRPDEYLRGRLA